MAIGHSGHFIVVIFQEYLAQSTNTFASLNMPKGGCACGNVRIEFTGEPAAKVCQSSQERAVPDCVIRTNYSATSGPVPLPRLQKDERLRLQHQRRRARRRL